MPSTLVNTPEPTSHATRHLRIGHFGDVAGENGVTRAPHFVLLDVRGETCIEYASQEGRPMHDGNLASHVQGSDS